MPRAPIIPNSEVIGTPLETHLCVMVLGNEVEEVGKQQIRFIFYDTIEALSEAFIYIDRFPASYRWGIVSAQSNQ